MLIESTFIDPDTCPQALLQIVCGPYTNMIDGFSSTKVLRKVVARVLGGCTFLLA